MIQTIKLLRRHRDNGGCVYSLISVSGEGHVAEEAGSGDLLKSRPDGEFSRFLSLSLS